MSNEPPFDDPHASPETYFKRYPVPERSERDTLRSLAEETSEPPGRISQPSAEVLEDLYDPNPSAFFHGDSIDPPRRDLRDTERPPPGESSAPLPSPLPEEPEEPVLDLMPRRQLNAALDRLESIAKQAKDAAQLCFDEIQQVRQVLSLLPCMKEDVPAPKCPALVPAE